MTKTYVEKFAETIAEITDNVKVRKNNDGIRYAHSGFVYDLADRTQRMALIDVVTREYVAAHSDVNQAALGRWVERGCKGERPSPITLDTAMIDRLTDVVLDEELTDPDPHKVAHAEYPFMSDWQLDLRRDRETSLKIAEEVGTDGRNYAVPKRRKRSGYENRFVDRSASIRNVERAAQYKRDTAPGPLVTYNLRDNGGELAMEWVACKDAATLWSERLSLVY